MLFRPVVATNFSLWYMKYRIKKNRRGYYLTNGKTRVGTFPTREVARSFLVSYVRELPRDDSRDVLHWIDAYPVFIVK